MPDIGFGGSGGIVAGGAGGSSMPAPTGFTPANIGGYKLGEPITGDNPTTGLEGDKGCNLIVGVVRDFKGVNEMGGHPDFESFEGDRETTGLVGLDLGADLKPVYTSMCEAGVARKAPCRYGQQTTSKAAFDQWYRTTADVNKPYLIYFEFVPTGGGVSTFHSDHFFPLDNAGWGNSGADHEAMQRNFGFTTELHTKFKYNGGEHFQFVGDDDLWVFINHKLAMDLGGLHPQVMGMIDLDAIAATAGLTKGNVYQLDLFHAERHTDASNFRVDTNFTFVDCGIIIK